MLRQIAQNGVEHIYKGETSTKIAEESLQKGGILIPDDFHDYRWESVRQKHFICSLTYCLFLRVKWSDSLSHIFRDRSNHLFTLHVPPPPSSAIMIVMILNIVEQDDRETFVAPNPLSSFYHKVIEAMKYTFAKKYLFGDSSNLTTTVSCALLNNHTVTNTLINY